MSNVSSESKNPSQVNLTEVKKPIPGEPILPKNNKTAAWNPIQDVLWASFLYVATQFAAAFLLIFVLTAAGWSSERATDWLRDAVSAQFFYILIAEVLMTLGIVWAVRRHRKPLQSIGLVRIKLQDPWTAVKGFGLYFLVYIGVVTILSAVIPGLDTEQKQQIGFETAHSTLDLLLVFASLVILPPVVEEFVFRGFIFTSLRSKLPYIWAAMVTSVLFAIGHLQIGSGEPLLWIAAVDTFVLSLVLCYVREKTGSLWPSIIIHAMKNMLAFSILFLFT